MSRKKPAPRVVVQRSRNNANRRLIAALPTTASRVELSARVTYGGYSKHKFNPTAYKLSPYAGQDEERTYCDKHANFSKENIHRIPALLARGVMLGLWSDQNNGDAPSFSGLSTRAAGYLNSELPTLVKLCITATPSCQTTLLRDMFWSEQGQ